MKAVVHVLRAQMLGLGSQVMGAAPNVVMSIYLARAVGLSAVADFALLIGISSVLFTVAMIGLRSRLVLDQFRDFDEADYYRLRIVASGLMTVAIVVGGLLLKAPLMLAVAVALSRLGDAALDLVMAIDQVRRDAREHMYGYLNGSIVKMAMIVVFLAGGSWSDLITPFAAYALASGFYAAYAWVLFNKRRETDRPLRWPGALGQMIRLIRFSAVFAVAQIMCALLTSAPRLGLPRIADRELAGAASTSLSVSTLIGMVYFAVWLRWVPRFGKDEFALRDAVFFLLEMIAALLLIVIMLWFVGAPVMASVYAIDNDIYLENASWTLIASSFFFFCMTLANLFKPTRIPWAESVAYFGGILAILICGWMVPQISIPLLLLAGTFGMGLVEVLMLTLLLNRQRGKLV